MFFLSENLYSHCFLFISMGCVRFMCSTLQARNAHSILFLLGFALLLIISGQTPFYLMAQGRQLPNAHLGKGYEEEEIGVRMIGSRPPRCGKCEAVQVPIAPRNRVEYSRGDDISSYKPMCWKCKCGDFFFNP